MKSVRLARGSEQWLVKYDEDKAALSVEGPAPTDRELFTWLTTPRRVIDSETGHMLLVKPVESWTYLVQAIDVGLYADMGLAANWDDAEGP